VIVNADPQHKTVLVTGGAGYVGSALIPKLLAAGHDVRVLDLYLYGAHVFDGVANDPHLRQIRGDIRDRETVAAAVAGVDAVIHLACISNDPSFELDPDLGRSINFDCFPQLVDLAKDAGVRRFVYASSSSVYGIKDELDVTEDLKLEPLTDYSKFKAMCEEVLDAKREPGFTTLTLRPATVCGFAPRLRLDVIVNILTNHAFNNRRIRVFGGGQTRPNIHVEDMTDLYVQTLAWPAEKIDGRVFNAGYYNQTVDQLAQSVRNVVGADVTIQVEPTDDNRSYRVSSELLRRELGFAARRPIEEAVAGLLEAFADGRITNSMDDPRYYNIKMMQQASLR
jgi:nucleoside-diphosphate-sugar epimerase